MSEKTQEDELQESREVLQAVLNSIPVRVFWKDKDLKYLGCNTPFARDAGFETSKGVIGKDDYAMGWKKEAERYRADDRSVIESGKAKLHIEEPLTLPSGEQVYVLTNKVPLKDPYGMIIGVLGTYQDITDRKAAEKTRQAHFRFIENLDRINRTIQGAGDLEKMLGDVLDTTLSIFDCDRVWLVYPCDPNAAKWQVPMELTKPGYPGVYALGVEMPMDQDVAEVFRTQLASNGPVKYGPGTEHPLPKDVSEQFGFKSFISIAIYPKVGSPWQFGMHQCAYARVWTDEEERLFKEIGRCLGDGLASLLSQRDLKENEERMRLTLATTQIGTFDWDVERDCWSASPEYFTMLGYEPKAGMFDMGNRRKWLAHVHPDDRDHVETKIRNVLSRGPTAGRFKSYEYEARIRHADGTYRWEHVKGFGVKYNPEGKVTRLLGVRMDITERKQAEAEVERLKNHLANIIDSMPSMLVGMDNNEIITRWNRQAETATGIPATEAVGRHIRQMIPDLSPHIEAMADEIKRNRPAVKEKLSIEKEGERRLYDLILFPLISNGAEGAVLRIEDVTERSRIQEMMIQTEKMMSLGGLAAGMAHEINNPLGIISQAAQNIERRISRDIPANLSAAQRIGISLDGMETYFEERGIYDFIGSIREATLRASRIIRNILRFSRGAENILKPTSPVTVLDQALELAESDYDLKKKYDFKSIEIVRDDAPDIPDVPMAAVEMEQVILNLLKNAAQAVAENPPERKPGITIRLRREDRYVRIEIEDNGPGMTEEVRRRVFEPFFTTKDPDIGTGLGLSVAYMIVTQNHKGLMEVDSTPGTGTCFQVRLPLG